MIEKKITTKINLTVNIIIEHMKKLALFREASAMSYITLLSIVPTIVLIFSVMSLFGKFSTNESNLYNFLKDIVLKQLTENTGHEITAYLNTIIVKINVTSLNITASIVFIITLALLLRHVESTFNRIWKVKKSRSVTHKILIFWTFLTILGLFGSVFFTYVPIIKYFFIQKIEFSPLFSQISKNFINTLVVFIFFVALFKWGPNCKIKWVSSIIGGIVSCFLFLIITKIFSYYVAFTAESRSVYGAIASIPIFMIWIYLVWIMILVGALISYFHQNRMWHDSLDKNLPFFQDKFQQERFKTILPCLILIWIHKEFLDNSLEKMNGSTIHEKMNVPWEWIHDACKVLQKKGYLVIQKKENYSSIEKLAYSYYYPLIPSENISLHKIFSDILQPASSWIKDWKHNIPKEVVKIMLEIFSKSKDNSSLSLKDLLKNKL